MVIMLTMRLLCVCCVCRSFNPIGSRMVHFKGKDLLVVAPKNDEYVGGHILATGARTRWAGQPSLP